MEREREIDKGGVGGDKHKQGEERNKQRHKQPEKRKWKVSSAGLQMLHVDSEVWNHQSFPLKTKSVQTSMNQVLKIKMKIDWVSLNL